LKNSIALFITIMFLVVIVSIINFILKDYDKFTSNSNSYIAQNNIIIKNSIKTLDKFADKIKSKEDLNKLFTSFAISNKDGSFRAVYTISPLFDKINIHNKNISIFLDNLFSYYQILDPLYLKNLILDTLDKDTKERDDESEIVLYDPFFQNGNIYNYKHLKKIIDYYYKKRDDNRVFMIPWQKYIYFLDINNSYIDCDMIDDKLALFLGIDKNMQNCKSIKEFDIITFDKNRSYLIDVDIDYFQNNIKIIYDINKKKVIKIENNPIY